MNQRKALLIEAEQRRQTVYRVIDRYADAQRAGDHPLGVVELLIHCHKLSRNGFDMAQDDLSCRCELNAES